MNKGSPNDKFKIH